ncbi:GGDEF domain-containing protein [Rhodanobacter sp. AS-Z3]|uniref:GGDEF domain-containing protein n=1 Tax=Rhodanobacter sp. AS-Z3 TaxID=3031330 RepID=UPI002479BF0F|nr:GGDEF domain-containing protein [Rhodanobacter sp. AS-Z3]WEN15842.1 GGDEF domain-containing protein [Rhodanobacter sp. AS-Z3]
MASSLPESQPSAAVMLGQAEAAWPGKPAQFQVLVAKLHLHEKQLTAQQRWHLQLLDTWPPTFDGKYASVEAALVDIIDHSGDKALAVRAQAALLRGKFFSRHYVEAYALANALMVELPTVTDPTARMEAMYQIILMLNRTAVGQYDLALQYARQMKSELPSPKAQCFGSALEVQSLLYGDKVTSGSPEFQHAIDVCLAAGVPEQVVPLRLDLASELIFEGHASRAITLLQRIAPDVRKTRYTAYLASLPVTLAQAYLSRGDAAKAREYALASIAVTGADSPLWTLPAAYKVLYEAEKMSGNDTAALTYYEKYVAQETAALDDAKASALAYQMVRQQVEAKKVKLDALSKQNSILQLRQALTSQAQRTSQLFIVLLLVVLAFITLAMVWLRRSQLRFRNMARHDGLTGAFNREHFFEEARGTLRRLSKTKTSVCLVVLDLDHFKLVNDTYGHAAGDVVLRHAVAACQGELRGSDVFGRLGGEEFGLLMPGCSREQGVEIATRIRLALAAMPMVLDSDSTIHVSASFGLVCSPCSELTLHQLLRQADLALYRAKESGRNRVDVSADASTRAQADEGLATHA